MSEEVFTVDMYYTARNKKLTSGPHPLYVNACKACTELNIKDKTTEYVVVVHKLAVQEVM
jgi:hypothetical protein